MELQEDSQRVLVVNYQECQEVQESLVLRLVLVLVLVPVERVQLLVKDMLVSHVDTS